MSFLSKFFGQRDAVKIDSQRIYRTLMTQSRKAEFYGAGRVSDNYDGRIDVLTLHIACVLMALNSFGEQGERLAQAVFDEMKDDFEVALREEGLSDTGVAKRIKPMISHFYARVKVYTQALLDGGEGSGAGQEGLALAFDTLAGQEDNPLDASFKSQLMTYTEQFSDTLMAKSLGQIALCGYDYPNLR